MRFNRVLRFVEVSSAWRATGWYIVLTVAMTWPLVPNIARDIPGDLGDPLFNAWVIGRAANHWAALLSGDFAAATRFWHAGIFHPEPYTTAYSDHLVAHGLMILPVWLATKNIILCYNLLFLASFVLSGAGMYLLARELTGSSRGAFVAGLLFMFTPYRFATMAHLQVISSQWMPFALYGLRRYFTTGRKLPLAGGAAAVLLQNLSSGYYMVYFAPFVALYAVVELWLRHLLLRWRIWRDLGAAGAATLLLTLPFAVPYLLLQRHTGHRRSLDEIQLYAADLLGWLTASADANVWNWLQLHSRAEGVLFPGLLLILLAGVGVATARAAREARVITRFAVAMCFFAMWMAMGPVPTMGGAPLPIPALYRVFYDYVPGFDASRVTSRFTTMVVLFLAMAAAYGLAWLDGAGLRRLVALVALGVLLEGAALPLRRNLMFSTGGTRLPAPRVYAGRETPPLWRFLKTLPPDAVLAHLPIGHPEHDLRYQFYSLVDGHRLSNGYSGTFPDSYRARVDVLRRTIEAPEAAIERLHADGVTHVIVHMDLFGRDAGLQTASAFQQAGLTTLVRIGPSVVLHMPAD